MNDNHWARIIESAQILADLYDLVIPAQLVQASGNFFERDRQRREALNAFMEAVGYGSLPPHMALDLVANEVDEYALCELTKDYTPLKKTTRKAKRSAKKKRILDAEEEESVPEMIEKLKDFIDDGGLEYSPEEGPPPLEAVNPGEEVSEI